MKIFCWLAWTGLFASASAAPATDATITILHTNDIHGHVRPWRGWDGELRDKTIGGLDRVASVVERVRAEVGRDRVLLLDTGDTFGDSTIADETQGKALVTIMNAIGYDAMVIGNHEPDYTAATLRQRMTEARFPVLAANIVEQPSGRLFARPYLVKNVGGVKVGILGLAYPNTALTTAAENVRGLEFRDAPQTARTYLPKLRAAGAEVVIVLSHDGLAADKKLAKEVPGIDVIVGGHSHNRMAVPEYEGQTLIVQAGAHASDVGRLDLTIQNGKIVDQRRTLVLLDNAKIPSDPKIQRLIDTLLAPYRADMDREIAEASTPIVRAQILGDQEARPRDAESPADKLFADILRETFHTDIALLPGVGYGVALHTGPVRAGDLRNLIPHDSHVVTLRLSGRDIREILEQSLENTYTEDPRVKVGGLIQVSGLTFKYDEYQPYPRRLIEVHVGLEPLRDEREYSVATNSLLAQGGHRYRAFRHGRNVQEHGAQYEIVLRAFEQRKLVLRPEAGRAQKATALPDRSSLAAD